MAGRSPQRSASKVLAVAMISLAAIHSFGGCATAAPQVQLLVPVETGYELEQIVKRAPTAQLVEIDGRAYLRIGRFQDARVAYRIGRGLQQLTQLPFELAYGVGHPQLDGSWMAGERSNHGPLVALNPPIHRSSTQAVAASQHNQILISTQPDTEGLPLSQELAAQSDAALTNRSLASTPASPVHPWVRSLEPGYSLPVYLGKGDLAVNPALHYVFVKLDSAGQTAELQRRLPIAFFAERDGSVLARTGVFTKSPTGQRLMSNQIATLKTWGFDVLVEGSAT